ncbi:phosphoribosyltransferase family protein [Acidaminococcus fermentans]|jgi:hypoxanthine phosphoribosyltransferase|uniref:phosphoribosyltransferase family protein n=1 Tax=Acidaminococcus fermentans TaxID=905 RepID=UPI003F8C24D0
MDYLELSLKSLHTESVKLAQIIEKSYHPDLVIYVARGGYLIGQDIANYFKVPAVGIYAQRKGNKLKESLKDILKCLPRPITKMLREIELNSGVHRAIPERKVFWDADYSNSKEVIQAQKILIVDDSVDTGYSMKALIPTIKQTTQAGMIKIAAINVWTKSQDVIHTDYFNYKDTIIVTPMSNDSKEHDQFLALFDQRRKDTGKK